MKPSKLAAAALYLARLMMNEMNLSISPLNNKLASIKVPSNLKCVNFEGSFF